MRKKVKLDRLTQQLAQANEKLALQEKLIGTLNDIISSLRSEVS